MEIRGADAAQCFADTQIISGRISEFLAGRPRHRGFVGRQPGFCRDDQSAARGEIDPCHPRGPGKESDIAYRLNPEKLGQVRNELTWHWKNWVVLAVAVAMGIAASVLVISGRQ
jgi:hypothetical protein